MDEVQTIDMSDAPWFAWCHVCLDGYAIDSKDDESPCPRCGWHFSQG
jgi:rubrerythrin